MSEAPAIADRDELMLAELAELDLALAKRLHACAMAAEDPEAVGALSRGYQRIARSLRQTLALKAKLKRDREADLRAHPPPPPPPPRRDPGRIARRKDELRQAVRRVIWNEQEGEHADYLFDLLEDRLEQHGRAAAFGLEPLDEHIADLCADFGLTLEGAAAWRDLPDPEADPGFVDRRGDDDDDWGLGDEDDEDSPPALADRRSSA